VIRLFLAIAAAARIASGESPVRVSVEGVIRGAAVERDALYTWGDEVRRWDLPGLRSTVLARGGFGEGGCLADMNGDGANDVVLQEGARLGLLVWFEAPKWIRHVLDREIEMHDCIAATLLGHRGFLMIHRYSQVRFYEPGAVRDIYSIYTPSRQGGLALADIDVDGRTDILCGNYWIQSPASFDLPWRLFAINTINESEAAALFRLGWSGFLAASQGELNPGRVVLFHKPANVREQWRATVLAEDLAYPHALLVRDGEILAGENNGRGSRLFRFTPKGQRTLLQTGAAAHTLLAVPGGTIAVGPHAIYFWRR
jgi:hypothetical protein